MLDMPDLQSFLKTVGITSSSPEHDILKAKKAYKKVYHKLYYQERKKQQKRFTIRLSHKEYRRLQQRAKSHKNTSLHQYFKTSAFAYMDQRFIPHDTEAIHQLTNMIRSCGRTINQIVQKIHLQIKRDGMTGAVTESDKQLERLSRSYGQLLTQIEQMESMVKRFMYERPLEIDTLIKTYVQDHPEQKSTIVTLLQHLLEQKTTDHADH